MKLEQLLNQLESIVQQMETEELPIDKSTELFEQGIAISAQCFDLLSASNGKLAVLKDKIDKYEDKN